MGPSSEHLDQFSLHKHCSLGERFYRQSRYEWWCMERRMASLSSKGLFLSYKTMSAACQDLHRSTPTNCASPAFRRLEQKRLLFLFNVQFALKASRGLVQRQWQEWENWLANVQEIYQVDLIRISCSLSLPIKQCAIHAHNYRNVNIVWDSLIFWFTMDVDISPMLVLSAGARKFIIYVPSRPSFAREAVKRYCDTSTSPIFRSEAKGNSCFTKSLSTTQPVLHDSFATYHNDILYWLWLVSHIPLLLL